MIFGFEFCAPECAIIIEIDLVYSMEFDAPNGAVFPPIIVNDMRIL